MDRVVKYRAWNGKTMDYDYRDVSLWNGLLVAEGDTVLMQFTGLIDANGKEMWEGDIVKMPGARQAMWVEYQPPAFVMRHKTPSGRKSESWSTFDLHFTECQFVEVIGNIYEQPELLEVPA